MERLDLEAAMGLRFTCPSTGHKIDTTFEVDDDDPLLLCAEGIGTQCSFCGGLHEWVFVAIEAKKRKSRPKRLRS